MDTSTQAARALGKRGGSAAPRVRAMAIFRPKLREGGVFVAVAAAWTRYAMVV